MQDRRRSRLFGALRKPSHQAENCRSRPTSTRASSQKLIQYTRHGLGSKSFFTRSISRSVTRHHPFRNSVHFQDNDTEVES